MDQIKKKFAQLKIETDEAQARAEQAENDKKLAQQRIDQVK